MGVFSVKVDIARPAGRTAFIPAGRILVDTGAEMTWISADLLRRAKIQLRKKDQPFIMANGQQVTRSIGYAIIRSRDFETVDEVVFAQPSDLQWLGARTLEGFNAAVDPRRKRLVAAEPMPAAGS